MSEKKCGRDSTGWLMWPGSDPMPMCGFHKEAPLRLGHMMGWTASFILGNAGPCESIDSHPDDAAAEEQE